MQLQHSVEADAGRSFAWKFRTDTANWNDPPAQFHLDGPFVPGSRGRTVFPDRDPVHWRIADVHPEECFVIAIDLDGATLSFTWIFDSIGEHRTRLTQRIELSGERSAEYADPVEAAFGDSLKAGMERIANDLAAASRDVFDD
jgi:hypothetical protein